MARRTRIATQGLIIVALLFVIEGILVATIYFAVQDTRERLAKEQHVFDVLSVSNKIANTTQKLGTLYFQDALQMRSLGDTPDTTPYQRAIFSQFAEFRIIAKNDPKAQEILKEQQRLLDKVTNMYKRSTRYHVDRNTPEDEKFVDYILRTRDISAKYDRLLTKYKTSESSTTDKTSESITFVEHTILLGLALNLVAGMLLAYFFTKRIATRINVLTENVALFQSNAPLHERMQDGDEIGKLDELFHQMVTSITDARHNETTLVEDAYDVICTIDSEGLFGALNAACQKQWGYDREKLLDRHFDEVIDPRDCLMVNQYLDSLKNKSSSSVSFKARLRRADGVRIDTSWSCYWSANDRSAFCFVRDETEVNSMENLLKAREEQVRALMRNIPIGLIVVDDNGVIKSANHKIESLLNASRGNLPDQNFGSLVAGFHGNSPSDWHGSPHKGPTGHVWSLGPGTQVRTLKNVDGEIVTAEVTIKPISESDDSMILVEDIRERVRLENMKKAFVALLRESLRAPLLKVRDMLKTSGENADEKTLVRRNRVISNSERLLRLIDELLSVESLRPGQIVGDLKPERIENIVEAATELLKDYSVKQGVGIKVEPLSAMVMADFDRLVQVVVNLLSNAIKFSPAGSDVVVSVQDLGIDSDTNTANSTANGTIEVSVTDSGRGVPLELQESIFKPYVQASASDRVKGTGLGLPICRTIIESHFGTIGVTSEGDGSTFWFRIPKVGE